MLPSPTGCPQPCLHNSRIPSCCMPLQGVWKRQTGATACNGDIAHEKSAHQLTHCKAQYTFCHEKIKRWQQPATNFAPNQEVGLQLGWRQLREPFQNCSCLDRQPHSKLFGLCRTVCHSRSPPALPTAQKWQYSVQGIETFLSVALPALRHCRRKNSEAHFRAHVFMCGST